MGDYQRHCYLRHLRTAECLAKSCRIFLDQQDHLFVEADEWCLQSGVTMDRRSIVTDVSTHTLLRHWRPARSHSDSQIFLNQTNGSNICWIWVMQVSPRCAATEDPFNRLGVAPNSTKDVIRKAYRKLVLRVHPDLHPDGSDQEFIQVHLGTA